jgi:hypothetical protein
MKILLSYARSTFWTVAALTVLLGLLQLITAVRHIASRPAAAIFTACFALLIASVGTVTGLAARALRRQGRFARTLVALASVYNLLIFPFGTVAAAVALYWCFSPKLRALEPLVEDFDFQSKKGDGTHKWIQVAVSASRGAILLGSLGAVWWWGERHQLPNDAAVNGLLLLFLCEWVAVFFHELGHATAGWLAGMRLSSFSVGPFAAQKRAGRWKFGFTLAPLIGGGGGTATVPLHLRNLRRRMAFEIVAGPVASLLTAVIAMAVLWMMPGGTWVMWWKVPAVIAAISMGGLVINLIPFGSAAGYSDGALLVQLLRGGPMADMREALKVVGVTTASPLRPRDLDAATLDRAVKASAGDPSAGILRMLEMICAVDRGEMSLARVCLDSALDVIPSPEKADTPGLAVEIGFYLAYLDGHAERAGQWLRDAELLAQRKKFPLTSDFDYWRAVAAVRMAEGRNGEADDAWQRARDLADCFPKVGLYEYERDVLDTVRERNWLRPCEADLEQASA